MSCPNCGGTLEYTNWYDEKTQKVMYKCYKCSRLFIEGEIPLVDVTDRNDIGNILMGRNLRESLKRIEKKFKPLDKLKKALERGE